jgi:hypothetical protein
MWFNYFLSSTAAVRLAALISVALNLSACGTKEEPGAANTCEDLAQVTTPPAAGSLCSFDAQDFPTLTEACTIGVANPTRLALTTTDYSTGAVSVVDLATRTVQKDVALAGSDALVGYHAGSIYVLNRNNDNYVDLLDGSGFQSQGSEYPIRIECSTNPNPHSITFTKEGYALLPNYGHASASLMDFSQDPAAAIIHNFDLNQFADADGNAEASLSFRCGDIAFVSVQRLDGNFTPVDCDLLVPIDLAQKKVYASAIPINGRWLKQIRKDPSDAKGHTILTLSSGIERVNLATGEVSVLVSSAQLESAAGGSDMHFRISDFDINAEGTKAYLAIATDDYLSMSIWQADLDGSPDLVSVISNVNASERTLNIVGTELWFGDTTSGASGVRVFDLNQKPPSEIGSVRNTGLAPYYVTPIP